MDQWTKQIFDQANEVLYSVTAVEGGRMTLTQYSPETSTLATAINKGYTAAAKLADAMDILRFYANQSGYEAIPSEAKLSEDKGAKARTFLDQMLD